MELVKITSVPKSPFFFVQDAPEEQEKEILLPASEACILHLAQLLQM